MKNYDNYIVNKIYSTPHYIVLELYYQKIKQEIGIGRGKGYCNAGELNSKYARKLKIKDNVVDYLRKYIERAKIEKMYIFENKILVLNFKKTLSFIFYYEDHELKFKTFETLEQLKLNIEKTSLQQIQALDWNENSKYDQELELKFNKKFKTEKSSKHRKMEKIKGDLIAIEKSISFSQELKENNIEFGEDIQLPLKKIKFGSQLSHWQKRDRVFSFIKNLKKVYEIQIARLKQVESELLGAKVPSMFESNEFKNKEKIRIEWGLKSKTKRLFDEWKLNEIKIYVGKSAKGNNLLLDKHFANDDTWGHPDDVAGPHIIVKNVEVDKLNQELVNYLGSMLQEKYECKFQNLIFSRKNDLRRVAGKLGQVQLKESIKKTFKFTPDWRNKMSLVESDDI